MTEKSNLTPCGFGVCGTATYSNDIVNEGFYANDIPTRNATMINAAAIWVIAEHMDHLSLMFSGANTFSHKDKKMKIM